MDDPKPPGSYDRDEAGGVADLKKAVELTSNPDFKKAIEAFLKSVAPGDQK